MKNAIFALTVTAMLLTVFVLHGCTRHISEGNAVKRLQIDIDGQECEMVLDLVNDDTIQGDRVEFSPPAMGGGQ